MNHLLTTISFSHIIKKKLLSRFLLCSAIMFLSFDNATSQDITIEYGNKVSGEMPADQTYIFSFTGVDGDNIRIKSYLNGGYGKIVLISPTNSIVKEIDTGKQYNDLELTLDNSGVYKIQFSHDFVYSRNYSVGIYKLNDSDYSTPMEYGELYSGEIGVCGMNIYSFSGTAGENIRIKNYLNDGYGAIEVRSPNNDTLRFVDNRKEFNDIELTLDITGNYQIFVYHDFPYSRDFSISLYKLNDTNYSNQVDFGETYSGSIKRCEMMIYEFTGSQNDSVVIQSYVQGGKGIIEVRSQDSDTIVLNNIISEYDSCMLKLEDSGVYQIYIYHNYVYSRNYRIKVNDMNLTGIKNDILLGQYVKIFPNPVKVGEELNINIYSTDLIKGNISIYSNSGQEIYRSTSWQPKIKMDRLSRGVYFLKLNLKDGGFVTKKIVVD